MQNLERSAAAAAANMAGAGLPLPYTGLKVPTAAFAAAAAAAYHPTMTQAAFEFHRAQLYSDYSVRFHLGMRYPAHGLAPYHPSPHDPLAHPFFTAKYDPRARFVQEEPKPQQSYIGLIAMAILSSKEKKLVLSDIYQWILDNYPYFRTRGPGWRNSIRHNLSLNDCFVKAGRSANGKGHYWAIHPANTEDFKKGDFRRRKAQRRVRKAMGLAVPDDEESPSPPPPTSAETIEWRNKMLAMEAEERLQQDHLDPTKPASDDTDKDSVFSPGSRVSPHSNPDTHSPRQHPVSAATSRKRLFDVESLLAPDNKLPKSPRRECSDDKCDSDDEYIDVDSKIDVENVEDDGVRRCLSRDFQEDQRPSSRDELRRESVSSPSSVGQSEDREEESSPSVPVSRDRAPWMSPLTVGTSWPDHPSAFHSANTVTAWSTIPHPGFPVTPYPLAVPAVAPGSVPAPNSAEALAAQQRWQETFTRIVSRTFHEKNVKVEAWCSQF